jgi:hypothetical protein
VGVNDIVCGEKTQNVNELREVIIRAAVYQRNIRMYQRKTALCFVSNVAGIEIH